MRMSETTIPNPSAAATAIAWLGAGASNAGAVVQKAAAASPDENEQFRWQAPSNE